MKDEMNEKLNKDARWDKDAEFSRCKLDKQNCLLESKQARRFYLIWLANVNVFEEWCQRIRKVISTYQRVMSIYHYSLNIMMKSILFELLTLKTRFY
jgi:hypothetical protein